MPSHLMAIFPPLDLRNFPGSFAHYFSKKMRHTNYIHRVLSFSQGFYHVTFSIVSVIHLPNLSQRPTPLKKALEFNVFSFPLFGLGLNHKRPYDDNMAGDNGGGPSFLKGGGDSGERR